MKKLKLEALETKSFVLNSEMRGGVAANISELKEFTAGGFNCDTALCGPSRVVDCDN